MQETNKKSNHHKKCCHAPSPTGYPPHTTPLPAFRAVDRFHSKVIPPKRERDGDGDVGHSLNTLADWDS